MTLQHTLFAIVAATTLTAATLPQAEAKRTCPNGMSVGANQPCGPQTAMAKKQGKGMRSVDGLKMEQDVVDKPRKKPGKTTPRD